MRFKIGKYKSLMIKWDWHLLSWFLWSSRRHVVFKHYDGLFHHYVDVHVRFRGPLSFTVYEPIVSMDPYIPKQERF